MEYAEVIEVIRPAAGVLSSAPPRRRCRLADRLPRGEARHMVRELPAELKPWACTETDAEAFDLDEFLNRVAKREDTDPSTALLHERAVFSALGRAIRSPSPTTMSRRFV